MTSTIDLEGTAVRVAMGSGSFLHGDVQEVNADSVKVKGRWFPISAVQTEEDVESQIKANVNTDRRLRRVEQEAKEAAELALKGEPKIPVILSEKKELTDMELSDFISYLMQSGYSLHIHARADGLDKAIDEYRIWSGGEELPEDCIYLNDTAFTEREWFLKFNYDDAVDYPFPIVELGTVGRGHKSAPRGLHRNGRVGVYYAEIAEYVVRAGLRARKCSRSHQSY